jgi:hypothetical protein
MELASALKLKRSPHGAAARTAARSGARRRAVGKRLGYGACGGRAAGFFPAYHCRASSASASASQSRMILRRTLDLPREEALLDVFPGDGGPLS